MLAYGDLSQALIQRFPELSAKISDRESGPYVSFGQFFRALKDEVESVSDPLPMVLGAIRFFEEMCESTDRDLQELVAIDLIYDIAESPLLLDIAKGCAKGRLAELIKDVGPNRSLIDPFGGNQL